MSGETAKPRSAAATASSSSTAPATKQIPDRSQASRPARSRYARRTSRTTTPVSVPLASELRKIPRLLLRRILVVLGGKRVPRAIYPQVTSFPAKRYGLTRSNGVSACSANSQAGWSAHLPTSAAREPSCHRDATQPAHPVAAGNNPFGPNEPHHRSDCTAQNRLESILHLQNGTGDGRRSRLPQPAGRLRTQQHAQRQFPAAHFQDWDASFPRDAQIPPTTLSNNSAPNEGPAHHRRFLFLQPFHRQLLRPQRPVLA